MNINKLTLVASENDIDSDKVVWLLGLAVTLLAKTRIAEMKDNDD